MLKLTLARCHSKNKRKPFFQIQRYLDKRQKTTAPPGGDMKVGCFVVHLFRPAGLEIMAV